MHFQIFKFTLNRNSTGHICRKSLQHSPRVAIIWSDFITVIMLHTTSATRAATDRMHGSWTNWTLQSLHIVLQWSWFFTYWAPFRFLPLWLHVGNKMQTITISTIYNVNIAINFISNIIFDSFKTTQAVRSAEVAKRGNSVPYLSLIWESWFVCITPQRQRS